MTLNWDFVDWSVELFICCDKEELLGASKRFEEKLSYDFIHHGNFALSLFL